MLDARQKFLVCNFVGFQLTWLACAYGASHELPYIGALVGLLFIVMHFIFVSERELNIKVLLLVAVFGVLLDYMNTQLGVVSFPKHDASYFILPFWLVVLWSSFTLMLPHSLYWLTKNMYMASLAGAIGGSLSYLAGHKLDALSLSEPLVRSTLVYAVEWAIILPIGLMLVKKLAASNA